MKIDFKGILEGLHNAFFVKDSVEKIAAERIAVCNTCPHYSPNAKKQGMSIIRLDNFCLDCGCNMWLKTRALSVSCPLGSPTSNFKDETPKWLAVMSDEEAIKVEQSELLKKEMDEYKIKLSRNQIIEN